jgi:hypothetical protein
MLKFLTEVLPISALLVSLVGAVPAQAQLACRQIFQNSAVTFESSVEMEMSLTAKSARLLTSTDGTLASLFDREQSVPPEVISYIEQQKASLWKFSVEALPPELKALALKQSIIARKMSFGQSAGGHRIIPGIKVKDEYQKRFEMRAGVDLGSDKTVKDGDLIELHLRSKAPSGELIDRAAQVFRDIGYVDGSLHMHIVMPLMQQWLQTQPKMNTWRLIEFWRRLNLTFEMRDVIENGNSIQRKEKDGMVSFAPLEPDEMGAAFRYLYTLASQTKSVDGQKPSLRFPNWSALKAWLSGRNPLNLGSEAKMGWIGFWGHDKYDGPGLMGFEFRFLSTKDRDPELRKFLSEFPERVQNRRFGLSEAEMQNWFTEVIKADARRQGNAALEARYFQKVASDKALPTELTDRLNPHRSYESLVEDLPFEFKKLLLGMDQAKAKAALESHGRLRYLIHDWSYDPILLAHEDLILQIHTAQLKALRRWARGENERQVVQEFLLDSGLYFAFAHSIDFEI